MPCCHRFGRRKRSVTNSVEPTDGNANPTFKQLSEEESQNDVATLQNKLEACQKEITKRDSTIQQLKETLSELNNKLRITRRELAATKEANENLNSTLLREKQQNRSLKDEKTVLQAQYEDEKAELTSALNAAMQGRVSTEEPGMNIRRVAVVERRPYLERAPVVVAKSQRDEAFLYKVLREHLMFKRFNGDQISEVVSFMKPMNYDKRRTLIKQGDDGDRVFVMKSGECQVIKNGKNVATLQRGAIFGHFALMFKCKRTASIISTTSVVVWYLERDVYQFIMEKVGRNRAGELMELVGSALPYLSTAKLRKIADAVQEEEFEMGTCIVREGEIGKTFYIIKEGDVDVTIKGKGEGSVERLINTLSKGKFFGEHALQMEGFKRTASVIAQSNRVICLTLDKKNFDNLIGGRIDEIRRSRSNNPRSSAQSSRSSSLSFQIDATDLQDEDSEKQVGMFSDIKFEELEKIARLGAGGFGSVDLVGHPGHGKSFALKKIKKHSLVEKEDQLHLLQERNVMKLCRSKFIVTLFKTFQDKHNVYMLMEACMGGELWSLKKRQRGSRFSNGSARFYVGCVVEALRYLVWKGVVHRDIKPENLLVNDTGYLQLADFGYAKILKPGEKTYTFCGTLHYMAPEIRYYQGADIAVDYWALGILIFELLTGNPPFNGSTEEKVFAKAARGIEAVIFPSYVARDAKDLIRGLCSERPTERLGYLKNGINDVRYHKWFHGFDWDGLQSGTYRPEYVPELNSGTDTRHFDKMELEKEEPIDDNFTLNIPGWDEEF